MDAGKRGVRWEPSTSSAALTAADARAARNAATPPPSGFPGDATAGAARARAALAGGGTGTGAGSGERTGRAAGGAAGQPDDGLFAADEALASQARASLASAGRAERETAGGAAVSSGDFEAEAGILAHPGHTRPRPATGHGGRTGTASGAGTGAEAGASVTAPARDESAVTAPAQNRPAAGAAAATRERAEDGVTAPARAQAAAGPIAPAGGRAEAAVTAPARGEAEAGATAAPPGEAGATAPAPARGGAGAPAQGLGAAGATAPARAGAPGWGAPDLGAPATFVLLRHGETALTPEKRFSGSGGSDPELSGAGLRQADAVAAALAARGTIQEIVSSPLKRCRQTAEAVAVRLGLDVRIEDGLRETDFGAWEGLTFAEVRERYPEDLDAWLASPKAAPTGGGESFATVSRRVSATRDRLTAASAGRTVLLVTHVTPIKTLVRLALGAPPESLFRMELSAASLSAVAYYTDGNASVRLLNDTSHLR
uniref:histidine phosphatase family protein n=1 Tax=Streptomyces lateritius TaxID=67313 RepID=UPI0027E52648|nr:histidine phosphatase family protein [Streptomyces lateritius]